MRYLGIEPVRPRVAVFDFTGCEGCQLQLANKEDSLLAFLQAVELVNFREISSAASDEYDIAFVDGCISREDEVERLQRVRERAGTLVALGTCACFGGVSRHKDSHDAEAVNREVYPERRVATAPVRAIGEVVPVDLQIPGCPVTKAEVERIIQHLVFDVPFHTPSFPVCLECKQRFVVCRFELGQLCLGAVTRAGCGAPCPAGGLGCWGCRGPAADPNLEEFIGLARERGFGDDEIDERLSFFGGFEEVR
jgi:coenzyme F420-reducing hydrogenase gamma subunit